MLFDEVQTPINNNRISIPLLQLPSTMGSFTSCHECQFYSSYWQIILHTMGLQRSLIPLRVASPLVGISGRSAGRYDELPL